MKRNFQKSENTNFWKSYLNYQYFFTVFSFIPIYAHGIWV